MKMPIAAALLVTLSSLPARAGDPAACTAVTDASTRLACYDAAFAKPAATTPDTPAATAPQAAIPAPAPVASTHTTGTTFGGESLPTTQHGPAQDDTLHARLVGHLEGWQRGTTFTLDNGQVWQCTDEHSTAITSQDNPQVQIERGWLGAYYLSVEGLNLRTKVKRVQ